MATVAQKAFYAQLHGLAGVITRPADAVLFLEHESGAVVTIIQADTPHLVVLGAVDVAMVQYVTDMTSGRAMVQYVTDMTSGRATVVCSREQGRQ